MTSEEIFNKVDKFARKEIETYDMPQIYNYEIANNVAEKLANQLGVDANLAKCATALMDIKLGEAVANKKQPEHIQMSADYAEAILNEIGVDIKTKTLLVNAVLSHHGKDKYDSVYAEMAANADAYRFISELGVFTTFKFALQIGKNYNEALDFVQFKLDEKFNVLSIESVKKELGSKYYELSNLISKAKLN